MLAARVELAQSLIAAKSATAALDLMDKVPAEQRGMAAVRVERNWALYALGDETGLRTGIDQGLSIARTPDFLLQDGLLKQKQGDLSGARAAWEEALQHDPGNVQVVESLAQSYAARNETARAIEIMRKFASQNPNAPSVQLLLGNWLLRTGDRAGARAAYAAAKAADPKFEAPSLMLAQMDISEGKLDVARQTLLPFVKSKGWNASGWMMLGLLETKAGNQQAASQAYRKVLEIDSNNVVALNNLANRLADQAQPDEALRLAQRAKEIAPDDPTVADTLGWLFYQKGIYRPAITQLEAAVQKSGRNAVTRYHLAMAYLKAGDYESGRQALNAAVQIDPKAEEAQMAFDLLRGLQAK
jgi:tetratricopeptide (TPR) repeat protein